VKQSKTIAEFANNYGETVLRFYLLEVARSLLPDERIKVCWRYPLPQRKAVEIIYSDERGRARASGTMKCGSNWVCPACMTFIQEQRRVELQTAMERSSDDMITVMVTYTVQHSKGDRLKPLVATMTDAYRKTRSGRYWQDIKKHYSIEGSVRSLEVTYGQFGWHPHFHELLFMDKSVLTDTRAGGLDELAQSLKGDIGGQWYEKITDAGLWVNVDDAFDVKAGNKHTAEYIAKFGKLPSSGVLSVPAYEMTHKTTKTARKGNFGVLDMLFAAGQGDNEQKRLFVEYAGATKGRSMIHWSRGLKSKLDIEVIRDEIAAQGVETETDRLLAELTLNQWRIIADFGHIGQVMTVANQGDSVALGELLEKIEEKHAVKTITLPQFDLGH